MSGRGLQCRRWNDGICNGGPCDDCRYEPANMVTDMKIAIWGYRLMVVSLVAAIVCVAVLA